MKGTLHKLSKGWTVWYNEDHIGGNVSFVDDLPLYPDDVRQIEECLFDNPGVVYHSQEVEFEIVDEFTHPELYTNVGWGDGIKYAKLIQSKEQQKQLITEITDLDAKDGLYDTVNELDKLAEKTFKGDDATTFVQREIWKDGYRKAQETLYTEEQVREAIRIAKSAQNETAFIYEEEEIIQSLKQPKKD